MIKILWISVRLGTVGQPRGGSGPIRPGPARRPVSGRTWIGPRSPRSVRRRRGPENVWILAPAGAVRQGTIEPARRPRDPGKPLRGVALEGVGKDDDGGPSPPPGWIGR